MRPLRFGFAFVPEGSQRTLGKGCPRFVRGKAKGKQQEFPQGATPPNAQFQPTFGTRTEFPFRRLGRTSLILDRWVKGRPVTNLIFIGFMTTHQGVHNCDMSHPHPPTFPSDFVSPLFKKADLFPESERVFKPQGCRSRRPVGRGGQDGGGFGFGFGFGGGVGCGWGP